VSADLSALTAAALAVPGVAQVSLEPGPGGEVEAVHLEVVPGADRVAVSMAVSALLAGGPGATVPRLQVAEAAPEPVPAGAGRTAGPVPRQRGGRPVILRSEVATSGLQSTTTVVLTCEEQSATGEARSTPTSSGQRRGAAQATLQAVERLVGDRARFELEHVEVVDGAGGDPSVLVGLTLVTTREVERLTGAAVVRDDEVRAVIRATLDAVNRRLEALL
jgi:hypothetical protein